MATKLAGRKTKPSRRGRRWYAVIISCIGGDPNNFYPVIDHYRRRRDALACVRDINADTAFQGLKARLRQPAR